MLAVDVTPSCSLFTSSDVNFSVTQQTKCNNVSRSNGVYKSTRAAVLQWTTQSSGYTPVGTETQSLLRNRGGNETENHTTFRKERKRTQCSLTLFSFEQDVWKRAPRLRWTLMRSTVFMLWHAPSRERPMRVFKTPFHYLTASSPNTTYRNNNAKTTLS